MQHDRRLHLLTRDLRAALDVPEAAGPGVVEWLRGEIARDNLGLEARMTTKALADLNESPIGGGYGWHGKRLSLDGADTTMPNEADVAEVLACGETTPGWDGYSAALLRLHDGRYMGWSSWWGPTGSGFCRDAYGGDVDVYFATSLDVLIWDGLDAMGRSLCGYPETRPESP